MFETTLKGIPLLYVILMAVITFFVLKLLQTIIPRLLRTVKVKNIYSNYFPLFKLISWVIFLLWCSQYFSKKNYEVLGWIFGLSALFLFVLMGFGILKDIVAGAILRVTKGLSINDTVRYNQTEGKIIEFSKRILIIQTNEGEELQIPYSVLLRKEIVKVHPSENLLKQQWLFTIVNEKIHPNLSEEIKELLLQNPNVHFSKKPTIEIYPADEKNSNIKVIAYTLSETAAKKVFQDIKDSLNL